MFYLAQKSWFFNSAIGDSRIYQASDFAHYFGKVLSTGLLHNDEVPGLLVKADGTDLRTYAEAGSAIMEGYAYENTDIEYLTHSLPEVNLDRIDRIVLRLDKKNANRYIKLFVIEGEPGQNPTPPALQRDSLVWELSLAQVRIRANTSTINSTDVLDERMDRAVCGLVYSLISKPAPADIQKGGYAVTATVEGQTDFEIPLMSFDIVGDGLTVFVGGEKAPYSSYELVYPRNVKFSVGKPIGTLVEFDIIRGRVLLEDDYVVTAGSVGIVDAGGHYESGNVEGVLQKIGQKLFKPRPPIYGIEIDEANSNPESAVTYIEDAIDLNINNPTEWNNYFPFNKIKPCVISTITNQFVTYLNPDNYSQREDGTAIDISSITGSDVFVEIPRIWWNIKKVGYKLQVRISSEKIDDDWVALAHQKGNTSLPKTYFGAFRAHKDGYDRFRSISNQVIESSSTTASELAHSFATNNNCSIINYYERYVLPNILYLIRYKTRHQKLLGGAVKTDNARTGATNLFGLYTDVSTSASNRAKFLGMEDVGGSSFDATTLVGPLPEFMAGITYVYNGGDMSVIQLATQNYTDLGSYKSYEAKGIILPTSIVYPSYVKGDNHLFLFPTTARGSSSSNYPFPIEQSYLTGADGVGSISRRIVGGASFNGQYRIVYRPNVPIN